MQDMREKAINDRTMTYCAYCGHEELIDVDGAIIAQHIRTCEKHPSRFWEKEAYERGLVDGKEELLAHFIELVRGKRQ